MPQCASTEHLTREGIPTLLVSALISRLHGMSSLLSPLPHQITELHRMNSPRPTQHPAAHKNVTVTEIELLKGGGPVTGATGRAGMRSECLTPVMKDVRWDHVRNCLHGKRWKVHCRLLGRSSTTAHTEEGWIAGEEPCCCCCCESRHLLAAVEGSEHGWR